MKKIIILSFLMISTLSYAFGSELPNYINPKNFIREDDDPIETSKATIVSRIGEHARTGEHEHKIHNEHEHNFKILELDFRVPPLKELILKLEYFKKDHLVKTKILKVSGEYSLGVKINQNETDKIWIQVKSPDKEYFARYLVLPDLFDEKIELIIKSEPSYLGKLDISQNVIVHRVPGEFNIYQGRREYVYTRPGLPIFPTDIVGMQSETIRSAINEPKS